MTKKKRPTSLNQIADGTHVVWAAGLENWINVETAGAQMGFQCQKHDDVYAAYSHPSVSELTYSAVTQSKDLFRHPVVEQLR